MGATPCWRSTNSWRLPTGAGERMFTAGLVEARDRGLARPKGDPTANLHDVDLRATTVV
jgi:hypothetical protein